VRAFSKKVVLHRGTGVKNPVKNPEKRGKNLKNLHLSPDFFIYTPAQAHGNRDNGVIGFILSIECTETEHVWRGRGCVVDLWYLERHAVREKGTIHGRCD